MQKVSGILGQVGLSAFSLIQTDLPRVGANLCRASHVLSLLAFPVFLGISSVAPELVSALLGEKWQPVVLPLQILSVVVPLRMLAGLVAPALVGIGRPDVALGNVVIAFFIMVPAFVIGMGWGLVGVSLAWALAYPVQFFILLRRSLPVLHSSLSGYLNAMRGAAVSGALMYLVVMSARDTLESVMVRPAMQLGLLIFVGMITYLSLLFIIHRQAYRELVVLIRP
jgi:O-antigen/teichoic acid export membrane protein